MDEKGDLRPMSVCFSICRINSVVLANLHFLLLESLQVQCIFVCCFFFLINLFIYLFLAALDLRCCARAFSSCGERGLLFVAVHGLLMEVASLVVEHGL